MGNPPDVVSMPQAGAYPAMRLLESETSDMLECVFQISVNHDGCTVFVVSEPSDNAIIFISADDVGLSFCLVHKHVLSATLTVFMLLHYSASRNRDSISDER
jgi:hypothetical protein